MAREWDTLPGDPIMVAREPGREHEYRVAYDEGDRIALDRYEWWEDMYVFDERVDMRRARDNTDPQKAALAKMLMKKHSDKTR